MENEIIKQKHQTETNQKSSGLISWTKVSGTCCPSGDRPVRLWPENKTQIEKQKFAWRITKFKYKIQKQWYHFTAAPSTSKFVFPKKHWKSITTFNLRIETLPHHFSLCLDRKIHAHDFHYDQITITRPCLLNFPTVWSGFLKHGSLLCVWGCSRSEDFRSNGVYQNHENTYAMENWHHIHCVIQLQRCSPREVFA